MAIDKTLDRSAMEDEETIEKDGSSEITDASGINWGRLNNLRDHGSDVDETDHVGEPDRLESDAPLDNRFERVSVADIYPDALTAATAQDTEELVKAYSEDHDPEHWISKGNLSYLEDCHTGSVSHTENCADAARAFQLTLEGTPVCAAAIDGSGLPSADMTPGPGEASIYTEEWAGKRFQEMDYSDIEKAVEGGQGSAIVHADGIRGGHAFNLYFSDKHNAVRYADNQRGAEGDLRPDLEERFPRARAIIFDRRNR